MVPSLPPPLAPYMIYLGLAAAGLPTLDALDLNQVYTFFTSRIGSKTGRLAVATNQRCLSLRKDGLTSENYLKCKNELENLVIDLLGFDELKIEKCVMSKVYKRTAECPVLIWLFPRRILVTHPLLVKVVKSNTAKKGVDREYYSTAISNGESKRVKIIEHGHVDPSSEESDSVSEEGKTKKN